MQLYVSASSHLSAPALLLWRKVQCKRNCDGFRKMGKPFPKRISHHFFRCISSLFLTHISFHILYLVTSCCAWCTNSIRFFSVFFSLLFSKGKTLPKSFSPSYYYETNAQCTSTSIWDWNKIATMLFNRWFCYVNGHKSVEIKIELQIKMPHQFS